MRNQADTRYATNAPGQRAGEPYLGQHTSNEERLLSQALGALTAVDREAVRSLAPAARGPLFPPRLTGAPRTELRLEDVILVDRQYPDSSAQFSGTSGGYTGSSTPSLGWW